MMKYFNINLIASVLLLVLLWPTEARSQMFSVRDDLRGFSLPTYAVTLGWEAADFTYTGREDDIQANRYAFSGPLLRLTIESPYLHLYAATGGDITGLEDRTFSQYGLKARHQVTMFYNNTFHLLLPLQLESDITTVTNTSVIQFAEFNQGVLNFSTGAHLQLHNLGQFRIALQVLPGAGIAFSSAGTYGGTSYVFEGGGKLYYDRLYGKAGLVVGYSYSSRAYDLSLDRYDYDLTGHRLTLGVTF